MNDKTTARVPLIECGTGFEVEISWGKTDITPQLTSVS